ncbi:MAG: hypothetical protein KKF41_06850 [Actinobacteria bacterium]|nr:hypothetical protein [Actinomycetota bacterium]MBU2687285.1 hypothetical protein [Actinomycetota bacterium]
MDLTAFVGQWRGQEVVAFCGPIKYRGMLESVLEGAFLVLTNVAVMNPTAGETAEYETCVLNVAEVSGLAYQEVVGRGGAASEEY